MAQNFIESCREQGFLLPPDVREWLAPDHLAWFVIDAVKDMDLRAFYAAYRADGHGAAAYEPSLMVTLVLFAFATGVRSSRAIERHCREHVAFRVITGNLVPDHVTIARFICRHQRALSELFTDVLKLCDKAGLVKSGVVSIDGTRIAGNANPDVNLHFEQIAREVLAGVRATDEADDQELGEARGDELPEQLRTAEGRREFLRQARERLLGDDAGAEGVSEDAETGGEAGEEVIGEPEAQLRTRSQRTALRPRSPTLRLGTRSPSARRRRSSRSTVGRSPMRAVPGAGGCPRPSASSSSIAGIARIRSFARASSGCCWRSSGWRPSCARSARATRRMRPTASRGGCATVVASAVRPIRISRRRCPRAR